jgi:3-phenylpropionate/cinnamic acid dioxygenase small subunit
MVELMSLSAEQQLDIHRLVSLHGHLADLRDFDRFGEVFTDEIVYDMESIGLGTSRGTAALRDAALAAGDRNPVGHHVTNIVITEAADGVVRVRSKFIGVMRDGRTGSGVYEDRLADTPSGWRIAHRAILPGDAPQRG